VIAGVKLERTGSARNGLVLVVIAPWELLVTMTVHNPKVCIMQINIHKAQLTAPHAQLEPTITKLVGPYHALHA
jgi:hypothetical protein